MYEHSRVIDSFYISTAPSNYQQQQENQLQRPRDDTAVSAIAVYLYRSAKTEVSSTAVPRSANQKPLALPRRGQRSRGSGLTVPVIAVYRQRLAKPQQSYPTRVSSGISITSSDAKQLWHCCAGDCCILTSISEATANRPRRRSSYINSNQRSNSQHDSRVINRCIPTAAAAPQSDSTFCTAVEQE